MLRERIEAESHHLKNLCAYQPFLNQLDQKKSVPEENQ